MTVTEISKRKRSALYDVFIDGGFSFSACSDILIEFNIYKDSEIDAKTISKAKSAQADLTAKGKAFDMLSRRDYTVSEIVTKLRQKGVTKQAAEKTCDYLKEKGFVDDEKTAHRFSNYLFDVKNYGALRVKSELYSKGIKGELADSVIEQEQGSPEDHILKLLKTKFKHFDLTDRESAKKVAQKLMRLGFRYEDIRNALKQYIELEGEDI